MSRAEKAGISARLPLTERGTAGKTEPRIRLNAHRTPECAGQTAQGSE